MILYYKDENGELKEYCKLKEGIWLTKKEIDGTFSYFLHSENIPKALEFASLIPCMKYLSDGLNRYLLSRMELDEIQGYDIKGSHIIGLIKDAMDRVGRKKELTDLREV